MQLHRHRAVHLRDATVRTESVPRDNRAPHATLPSSSRDTARTASYLASESVSRTSTSPSRDSPPGSLSCEGCSRWRTVASSWQCPNQRPKIVKRLLDLLLQRLPHWRRRRRRRRGTDERTRGPDEPDVLPVRARPEVIERVFPERIEFLIRPPESRRASATNPHPVALRLPVHYFPRALRGVDNLGRERAVRRSRNACRWRWRRWRWRRRLA